VYLCCFSFSLLRVVSVMRAEGGNCARFFENILFLFQQGTSVPLLFFFFTFSTGYHTWCTSAVFLFHLFNRIPHVVYLVLFFFLLFQQDTTRGVPLLFHRSFDLLGTKPTPTHPPTHTRAHTHAHPLPPTHPHTPTHTHTHTHTLPTHWRRHTHPHTLAYTPHTLA